MDGFGLVQSFITHNYLSGRTQKKQKRLVELFIVINSVLTVNNDRWVGWDIKGLDKSDFKCLCYELDCIYLIENNR